MRRSVGLLLAQVQEPSTHVTDYAFPQQRTFRLWRLNLQYGKGKFITYEAVGEHPH